jgi:SAM-dependent methyltransferase
MSTVAHVGEDYLEKAARLVAEAKRGSYERMTLRPGMAVLDVGCGPGIDTVELARLVGGGATVGIDRDPEMVRRADVRAVEAGMAAWVEHHQGDAAALPFANDSFDAVRCERLLQHVADPANVLAEMVRVARPGGRVVALDTDWGSHSVDGPSVPTERALARTLAETSLTNGYSGRRLYGLMKAAGLSGVTVESIALSFTDYSFWRMITRQDVVEGEAELAGLVDAGALGRWREEMVQKDEQATFFASVNMVLVCGSKPGMNI